jgi:Outer membrane protein beta-barrel family/Carboxypeptidase regulatory-like domain/TonB-dependent Receptor Plug Domain
MLRKLQLTISLFLIGCAASLAQTGALKITVKDAKTGDAIPFASVVVEAGGSQAGSGQTDFDGILTIKPLPLGKVNVKASFVGYRPMQISNVTVNDNKTEYVTVNMESSVQEIKEFTKVEYVVPLVDPNTIQGKTVRREDYKNMATRNVNSVAAQTAGVYQADEGRAVSVRGGRSSADKNNNDVRGGANGTPTESSTKTFIDGQRVIGSANLPTNEIEQISVLVSGLPAQYGDATSGVINITTRGPQNDFHGGIEVTSSQLTDAYGFNNVEFNLSGPLLKTMDTTTKSKKSILGFSLGGQLTTEKDANPSAIGAWKVKDDVLRDLRENPLRESPTSSTATLQNADFITYDDLEKVKARQNVRQNTGVINGKISFKPTKNFNFVLGGSYDYRKNNDYSYANSLFNFDKNGITTTTTWRVYGRITQKFGNNEKEAKDEKSASIIKNAFYTLQGGYSKFGRIVEDGVHKDNFFDYGYVGKFVTDVLPTYTRLANGDRNQTGFSYLVSEFDGSNSTNPNAANYTEQYKQLKGLDADNRKGLITIQNGGGLVNGQLSPDVYSLWRSAGYQQANRYSKTDNRQFQVKADFSADIKDHSIQLGFEYEQRNESFWQYLPTDTWLLMANLANQHISQLDMSIDIIGDSATTLHPRLYVESQQANFDRKLRAKLGYDRASLDWIDINSYSPDTYSIDMFSADELLNDGNSKISYYGYDYKGNKLKKKVTLKDFFNKYDDENGNGTKDADENFNRDIGSYQPIYMAGYIQDHFDFKDLKFNVGLRVDRFDANQKVLEDPYVFFETRKAGDVAEIKGKAINHPDNIGNDYVVYVDNIKSPTRVVGYRNGDDWYNSDGSEQADPTVFEIAGGGTVQPYLVNPDESDANAIKKDTYDPGKSFKDFEPQITLMPRIAFSFPISDVANFFAHYDVLSQRPPARYRMDPLDYFFIENTSQTPINNPNLKPERTTDYELGYSQVLSKSSAITLTGFYREMRNMIQQIRVNKAYPRTYMTFGNVDFGTVKGLSVSYDLRRINNVQLTASYTLQFADGTGSSATGANNLASAGLPNLRTTIPLDFDQRHVIVTNFDYRYASGTAYTGPRWFGKEIFANTGANLTFRAGSGIPYSAQSNITQGDADLQNVSIGVSQTSFLKGSVNGSRYPWQYRFDLRVDRNIDLKFGKGDDENKKSTRLNVYVQVLNLLNTKNIIRVYKATGNPDDDGYLSSAISQSAINARTNEESYRALYSLKVNDPANYSIPRRIRLGFELSF